jgi:hypothetical protein
VTGKSGRISLAICLLLVAVVVDAAVGSCREKEQSYEEEGFITHASILL